MDQRMEARREKRKHVLTLLLSILMGFLGIYWHGFPGLSLHGYGGEILRQWTHPIWLLAGLSIIEGAALLFLISPRYAGPALRVLFSALSVDLAVHAVLDESGYGPLSLTLPQVGDADAPEFLYQTAFAGYILAVTVLQKVPPPSVLLRFLAFAFSVQIAVGTFGYSFLDQPLAGLGWGPDPVRLFGFAMIGAMVALAVRPLAGIAATAMTVLLGAAFVVDVLDGHVIRGSLYPVSALPAIAVALLYFFPTADTKAFWSDKFWRAKEPNP